MKYFRKIFLLPLCLLLVTAGLFSQDPNGLSGTQPLAAPTLSANAIQPSYEGTFKPYLTIIAGSGKTSSVSGVLNDPSDPAATTGLLFTVTGTGAVLAGTSNNTAVVSNSNIIITENAGTHTV